MSAYFVCDHQCLVCAVTPGRSVSKLTLHRDPAPSLFSFSRISLSGPSEAEATSSWSEARRGPGAHARGAATPRNDRLEKAAEDLVAKGATSVGEPETALDGFQEAEGVEVVDLFAVNIGGAGIESGREPLDLYPLI